MNINFKKIKIDTKTLPNSNCDHKMTNSGKSLLNYIFMQDSTG